MIDNMDMDWDSDLIRDLEPTHKYLLAVALKDYDRVRNILDSGVPVDAPVFGHGATALTWAASHEREEIAALLIARGANVNAQDWEGASPLSAAVGSKRVRIVKLLLEHGADPLLSFPIGETPLQKAERGGDADIIELLRQARADNPPAGLG